MLIDSEPSVNSVGESDEAGRTPRPRPTKEKNNQLQHIFDLSADDDSEPFQTPIALRRKKRVLKYIADSEPDEEPERDGVQKDAVKRKRGQMEAISKKKETKGEKQVGVKLSCYQSMTYRFVLFRGGC
jgi:pyruvate carboxylase